jgi:hypothetical protein
MELVEGATLAEIIARGSAGSEDPTYIPKSSVEIRQEPAGSANGVAAQAGSGVGRVFRPGESGIPVADVLAIARQLADADGGRDLLGRCQVVVAGN